MVVGIFKTRLQSVVVDICNRLLGSHSGNTHGLKFEICHGSRCVLRQGLIYTESNLAADCHISGYKVIFNYLLRYRQSHFIYSPL